MPEMDGLAATAAEFGQAEASTGNYTPIIAMTAHAMKGDEQRCLEAGMDGYVVEAHSTSKRSSRRSTACSSSSRLAARGSRLAARGSRLAARGSRLAKSIPIKKSILIKPGSACSC